MAQKINDLKIGLGTYGLKGEAGVQAVKDAVDTGYRLFDTAFIYGNEAEVGQAINSKIADGVIAREDVFVTTKLWGIHHQKIEEACRASLKRLEMTYADLYLIHVPISFNYHNEEDVWPTKANGDRDTIDLDIMDIWAGMEKLVELGLVRNIGVSNFNSHQIERLVKEGKIKPACNEVECSPGLDQTKLIQFCRDHGIAVLAYSPLGQHNAETKKPEYLYDAKLAGIANKYGKTPAQVALRYTVQMGAVPIPKSGNSIRIKENFEIFDFGLTAEESEYLKSFHNPENRVCKFTNYTHVKNYPFHADF